MEIDTVGVKVADIPQTGESKEERGKKQSLYYPVEPYFSQNLQSGEYGREEQDGIILIC